MQRRNGTRVFSRCVPASEQRILNEGGQTSVCHGKFQDTGSCPIFNPTSDSLGGKLQAGTPIQRSEGPLQGTQTTACFGTRVFSRSRYKPSEH